MSIESLVRESGEELEVARDQLRRKLLRLHTRLRHLDYPLVILYILRTKKSNKSEECSFRFSNLGKPKTLAEGKSEPGTCPWRR